VPDRPNSPPPDRSPRRVGWQRMWHLGHLAPGVFLRRVVADYRTHQLAARSAQFAYYALLGLAPLFIVLIACASRLPLDGLMESFEGAIALGMPENVVHVIVGQIRDIQARTSVELVLGGLLLLGIAGSRLFLTIGSGLDSFHGVSHQRRFWRTRGVSLLLTGGVLLLLVLSMILLLVGPTVTALVARYVDVSWVQVIASAGLRWGVACGCMLLASSIIYWVVPSTKLPWYWLSPGSVVATGGWVAVTQGFRVYVENFARYNQTYGALGGVIVLIVWLYLTGVVLLLGGLINGIIYQAVAEETPK